MAVYATVADVERRWNQTVTSSSLDHVETLIDDAETVVQAYVPDLAERITAGKLTTAAVVHVVSAMVLRVLRNPQGYRSETAGDYSYQMDAATSAGRIFITAEERRLLLGGRGRVCTVTVGDEALEYVHRRPGDEWATLLSSETLPTP